MTVSEFVQAHRIRELMAGRSGFAEPPPLVCGNGTKLVIDAGAGVAMSHPPDDAGPWTAFRVLWIAGPRIEEWRGHVVACVQAGDLVRLLERLGWPEEQLGKKWKKRESGNVPAER